MYKQNLHLHTTYCDGKNTPEEMAEAAIAQGFNSIGFSGHAFTPFSSGFCMTPENTPNYFAHIGRIKKEYEGPLKIFLGLEFDMYSQCDTALCDYVIGSVHYLDVNGTFVGFDRSAETVQQVIDTHFGGDGMAYAKCYYETLAHLPEYGSFDILGHADIICKHAETENFFDESSADYRRWACNALDALVGKIPYFEVNTGAISRGYRTTPYPAPFLLDELKKRGFGAVITSDCHNAQDLSCHYPQAQKLLWDHGFRHIYILTEDGFRPEAL